MDWTHSFSYRSETLPHLQPELSPNINNTSSIWRYFPGILYRTFVCSAFIKQKWILKLKQLSFDIIGFGIMPVNQRGCPNHFVLDEPVARAKCQNVVIYSTFKLGLGYKTERARVSVSVPAGTWACSFHGDVFSSWHIVKPTGHFRTLETRDAGWCFFKLKLHLLLSSVQEAADVPSQASQGNVVQRVLCDLSRSMRRDDWPLGLLQHFLLYKGQPRTCPSQFYYLWQEGPQVMLCRWPDVEFYCDWLTSLLTHCWLLMLLILPFSWWKRNVYRTFLQARWVGTHCDLETICILLITVEHVWKCKSGGAALHHYFLGLLWIDMQQADSFLNYGCHHQP